jgi:hypothetical protein
MPRLIRWLMAATVAATGLFAGTAAEAKTIPGGLPTVQDATSVVPIMWEGQVWGARMSPAVHQGPAPNYWLATPDTVFTDSAGNLHLVAKNVGGTWYSAGVTSIKSDYGYGTYRYVVETPLSTFDPMAVVGMFTYNNNTPTGHQEIDVELSRWGQPSPTAVNTQFVIQPWRVGNNLRRFVAPTDRALTYEWTWTPAYVLFKVLDGTTPDAPVLKKWKANAPPKPSNGTKVHLNLWWQRGQPPYSNQDQSVTFSNFTYEPATS